MFIFWEHYGYQTFSELYHCIIFHQTITVQNLLGLNIDGTLTSFTIQIYFQNIVQSKICIYNYQIKKENVKGQAFTDLLITEQKNSKTPNKFHYISR